MISNIKSNINLLYSLDGFIANLNIICAFTEFAINNIICSKPLINQISKIINNNYQQNNIIHNDYFFRNQFNILLIKVTYTSGKNTYMKHLALLIIMAQIIKILLAI